MAWNTRPVRARADSSGRCRLALTVETDSGGPETIIDNAGGYDLWMDHLSELVETGSAAPIAEADAQPYETHYRDSVNVT